eukprot:119709-Chlamydomonas_euryale.AAC.5
MGGRVGGLVEEGAGWLKRGWAEWPRVLQCRAQDGGLVARGLRAPPEELHALVDVKGLSA